MSWLEKYAKLKYIMTVVELYIGAVLIAFSVLVCIGLGIYLLIERLKRPARERAAAKRQAEQEARRRANFIPGTSIPILESEIRASRKREREKLEAERAIEMEQLGAKGTPKLPGLDGDA